VWAVVLAVVAACLPLAAVVESLWMTADPPSDTGLGVLIIVVTLVIEVALAPIAAAVAIVLAVLARRDGPPSRRNAGIAFVILALGALLVVVQLLQYAGVWR
jgi:hypothetical protein